MTTPPFWGRTEQHTDAELRADIALCRKVLRDGYVNGYPLDSETEVEWRDWLSDFEVEAEMREDPATCRECWGSGVVHAYRPGATDDHIRCRACGGSGRNPLPLSTAA